MHEVLHGDCLELMRDIPSQSINMILCDLPYGTTNCKWDSIIPFVDLWKQYERIIKKNGAIVLTASQPFTSALVMSNVRLFKHSLVWRKNVSGNFQKGKDQPIKLHEDIIIFSSAGYSYNAKIKATYNPIMIQRDKVQTARGDDRRSKHLIEINYRPNPTIIKRDKINREYKLPSSIFNIPVEMKDKLHPTQKPVALFEYLIKTYSNECDLILDNCAGSGTTGIACINTNRNFILMEKDLEYFQVIQKRLLNHYVVEL